MSAPIVPTVAPCAVSPASKPRAFTLAAAKAFYLDPQECWDVYTAHDPMTKGTPPHIPSMASIREHAAEFTPNLMYHAGGLVKSLQAKAQPGAREGLAGKLAEVEVELKERRATRFARVLRTCRPSRCSRH